MRGKRKYFAPQLKYVRDNLKKIGYEGCAAYLNVTVDALKRQCSQWRFVGEKIPYLRTAEIGEIKNRTTNGVDYLYQKTENGWKRIQRLTPFKDKEKTYSIKPKPNKMPVLKKKPMAEQATQHGKMFAGKTLINQQREISVTPFNPETHERVRDEVKKCWVERKKEIKSLKKV